MYRKVLVLMAAVLMPFLGVGSAIAKNDSAGHEQLIRAFDAAWTRVVRSGQYRSIVQNFDEPIPGVIDATEYIVNQSDCLPNPDVTPFPENPKGRFAEILADEEILRGEVVGTPQGGGSTSDWFSAGAGGSDMSADMLEAILAEIAAHYGTGPITVTSIEIPFPFNTTSALQDGIFGFSLNPTSVYGFFQPVNLPGVTVDFLDQFNAKGGETEELRRLISRRSTCTFSSSGQYIHVPVGSPYVINSIDDLRAQPAVRICTGNLSTQLSNQYFPNNPVETKRTADIKECYEAIRDGDADIFINSLPVNPTATQVGVAGGPTYQPSVNTYIVAGTPYWVQQENIVCEPIFVPGPFPFGTFRECREDGND